MPNAAISVLFENTLANTTFEGKSIMPVIIIIIIIIVIIIIIMLLGRISSLLSVLLPTGSAQPLSSQHLAAVPTPNIAELVPSGFFLSTTMVFCQRSEHIFPGKNTSMFMHLKFSLYFSFFFYLTTLT